ncbi:MAG: hypothetical protein MUQ30_10360, partial [Anaerolineae bacterium]|nr:hypothetical protein [Anaerolineae bacterium]
PRVFDPAYCSTALLSGAEGIPARRQAWLKQLTALVAGYTDVQELTEAEKALGSDADGDSVDLWCILCTERSDGTDGLESRVAAVASGEPGRSIGGHQDRQPSGERLSTRSVVAMYRRSEPVQGLPTLI